MSNTKRPALQRKHTRATKAEQQRALDQGVRLVLDGKAYEVRAGDITALDAGALRREFGMPFMGVLQAMNESPDIDLIAAIVWLHDRMNGNRAQSYEDVAAKISYGSDVDIDITDSPEEVDAGDPED